MAFHYQILDGDVNDAAVLDDIREAVARTGRWVRFVEVRMAAGPTVTIEALNNGEDGYGAKVVWGSQQAEVTVAELEGAVEVADRLATAFYEMRLGGPKLHE